MQRILLMLFLLASGAALADAQTYQWIDDNGVISFSDDLNAVPTKYRSRVKRREDITTRNPRVRQELGEQERRAREEEAASPRTGGAPGGPATAPPPALPTPTPPRVEQPTNAPGELPPGRTKSQRIRDNIERRQPDYRPGY